MLQNLPVTIHESTRLLGEVISWTCPAVQVKHVAVVTCEHYGPVGGPCFCQQGVQPLELCNVPAKSQLVRLHQVIVHRIDHNGDDSLPCVAQCSSQIVRKGNAGTVEQVSLVKNRRRFACHRRCNQRRVGTER